MQKTYTSSAKWRI
jgi:hypothetical protein